MTFAWKASGLTYVLMLLEANPCSIEPLLRRKELGLTDFKQLQQVPLGRRTSRPTQLEG